jgi:ABC-type branched-subunit amino acid transport system permease subunit
MRSPGAILLLAAFAAAAAFTGFANSYYVFIMGTLALIAIAGIGLNVLVGLTGQVSFGHVGFYALGAYAVAILTTTAKIGFWLALPVAALLAGLVGALLAAPALRVRGPYLAMVTIAFGFIVEHSAVEWRALTGGQNGIMGIPSPVVLGLSFGERGVALAAIAVAAVLTLGFWLLARSGLGAAMRAVRDAEFAAASIGLDPVRIKVAAFVISAICAGIAGALFAPLSGFVTPSTFTFLQSILFVLVVVVGGAGTVAGPLVGALVVVLLPEVLASLAEYRLLFFGVLLLAVLWGAPEGIVGEIARWLRRRGATTDSAPPLVGELSPPAGGSAESAVEGLSIAFGGVRAAADVSFSARPGEVTSLIGPNGAGKTTVLNMLGGFYRPDAGAIRLGGGRIEGSAAHRIARAGVGRTYQTSQLFGSLSVIDNLALAARRGKASLRALEPGALGGLLAFVVYR